VRRGGRRRPEEGWERGKGVFLSRYTCVFVVFVVRWLEGEERRRKKNRSEAKEEKKTTIRKGRA
jgi:hypothetical protein